eukprot:scaffold3348_cov73-Phaeocystis_antarctica.AAC.4
MQTWHKELQHEFGGWQQRHLTQKRWTTPPGPMPGSELPLEWRYSEREWRALELYDRWLCGEVLTTEQEGRYEDDLDCGEIEAKGLREAELVNHILAAALRYDLSTGAGDALLGEVEMRTGDVAPQLERPRSRLSTRAIQQRAPATCWRLPCMALAVRSPAAPSAPARWTSTHFSGG